MELFTRLWESTSISLEGLFALTGLAVFALVFAVSTLRARLGRPFAIRALPAVERIRAALGRATETGEPVHVALGSGSLGDLSTADTLAGLALVGHLARRGALAEVPVHVRVGSGSALAGALATLERGATSTGYPEAFRQTQAEFVAPTPLTYAVGTAQGVAHEPMVANVLVGSFGPEAAMPIEAGAARGLAQVGGTSDPGVLPFFQGTVDAPLLGEEIYALGAGLGRNAHTGSLATQDVFRVLLAVGMVVLAVLAVLGR